MIEAITAHNFRSYEELHLEFGQGRLSIVYGDSDSDYSSSNGTGKSSLMYLLCWVLFGKWPGMENADSCVRNPVKKDCSGSVVIRKSESLFMVSRYRNSMVHGNALFIQQGEKVISGDLKVMNERVEALVGMNYNTFVQTLIFTGDKDEMFSRKTDKEQKSLLDAIIPLDFSSYAEKASAKLAKASSSLTEAESVHRYLRGKIDETDHELSALLEKEKAWKASQNSAALREKHETLYVERERLMETFVGEKESVSTLRKTVQDAQNAVDSYKTTWEQYRQSHVNWSTYGNTAKYAAALDAEITEKLRRTDAEIASCSVEVQNTAHAKTCYACGQVLQSADASRQVAETRAKQLEKLTRQREEIIVEYQNKKQQYATALQATGFTEQSYAEFWESYKAASQYMQDKEKTLSEGRSRLDETVRRLDQLEVQREKMTKTLTEIEGQIALIDGQDGASSPYAASIATANNTLHKLRSELEEKENAAKAAEHSRKVWAMTAEMFSGGKGSIQHFIFESMLPEMTATAQMFLSMFSANTLKVAFKAFREKGSKVVEGFYVEATNGGLAEGYGDLSGGEKRRVDLAIFLTLFLITSKHVFSPKVVFLDEIADTLDESGKQSIVEVLTYFCQQYKFSCLLLTNEKELVASVPHGYLCQMRKGITTLVPVLET